MSHETNSPRSASANSETPRRRYAAPVLKKLGSVRDLTLGSPLLMFTDGVQFQATFVPPM